MEEPAFEPQTPSSALRTRPFSSPWGLALPLIWALVQERLKRSLIFKLVRHPLDFSRTRLVLDVKQVLKCFAGLVSQCLGKLPSAKPRLGSLSGCRGIGI